VRRRQRDRHRRLHEQRPSSGAADANGRTDPAQAGAGPARRLDLPRLTRRRSPGRPGGRPHRLTGRRRRSDGRSLPKLGEHRARARARARRDAAPLALPAPGARFVEREEVILNGTKRRYWEDHEQVTTDRAALGPAGDCARLFSSYGSELQVGRLEVELTVPASDGASTSLDDHFVPVNGANGGAPTTATLRGLVSTGKASPTRTM